MAALSQLLRWGCFALALTSMAWGCSSSERAVQHAGATTEETLDRFHQHDHHVPDHKPQDYAACVASLKEHYRQLIASQNNNSGHKYCTLLAILADLARWLPELAGDSDMPKRPWDRVNGIASELQSVFSDLEKGEARDRLTTIPDRIAALEEAVPYTTERGVANGSADAVGASIQRSGETSQ